jgi:DNA-binding NtrC family response regulator
VTESKCRILVVDAYQDAADSLKALLEKWGHEACVAYDPVDAIRIADEFNPHVVILDIVLPLKDGFKLGTELMERHPKCKVAALTGMGSAEYVELSKKNGFKYHLLKPMNPEQLAQIIEHDLCSETKDCEECVS